VTGSELVDYDRVAPLYRQGRALSDDVLARWGAAVRPHLPAGPLRVADVGAGTGIFAAVWPSWGAAAVVAVEVSAAMAQEGRAAAPYVLGRAEALPLATAGVDVVWVSTAFHHFADQARAAAEIDRVLRPDGIVLIRTFLPDRLCYFELFPGIERALDRCPSVDDFAARFGRHGFVVRHVEHVVDVETTYGQAADWVERMRHADSLLTALTDDEVAAGVRALRATPEEATGLEISLVVLGR
jgi:ubiquinone/menaquinone biosynthesis C-methylase UbiE